MLFLGDTICLQFSNAEPLPEDEFELLELELDDEDELSVDESVELVALVAAALAAAESAALGKNTTCLYSRVPLSVSVELFSAEFELARADFNHTQTSTATGSCGVCSISQLSTVWLPSKKRN